MWIIPALVFACGFAGGLALSRLLYEGLFPLWGWMGRPIPALALASAVAMPGALVAVRASGRWSGAIVSAALPLLLNVVWLIDPTVGLERSRFLFGASLWLAAVLPAWVAMGDSDRRWRRLGPLFVGVALLPVYLLTMSRAVGAADTFEFQVVAPQLGIAHPTGYPLYLLLGKLFSLLPVGTVAWRLNLASTVFATLAAMVVFRLALRLLGRPLPALLGAVALGLVPVYWGQAIVAEVYTLHALIVAGALLLMMRLVDRSGENYELGRGSYELREDLTGLLRPVRSGRQPPANRKTMVALAFVLGLGMANHLTTLFLLPAAAIAVTLSLVHDMSGGRRSGVSRGRSLGLLLLQLIIAFTLPLLLYAYLPLRWAAVNGEPMGLSRFVEWVVGGRFQGALQWGAWLRDLTRREIVGRLLFDAWGWVYLGLAAVGLGWLLWRHWRAALVLLVTAAGFTFYALNYYVPDLAVFLIPTHVVISVWVAAGVAALFGLLETEFFPKNSVSKPSMALLFLLAMLPALLTTGERWRAIDQSTRDGGEPGGRGILGLPLAQGAAILADSEKIAPLYYLQQAEGLRPDLDIMVLPDEAAYRAELDARLAAGGTVYLARFLPGLEGIYYLRSAGPLVEVSREPLTEIPDGATPTELTAGLLRLLGYGAEPIAAVDPKSAALTLYWTRERSPADGERPPVLYMRWSSGGEAVGEPIVAGLHPVGDSYPVNAWREGEVVADYHLLPLPDMTCGAGCPMDVEVAVAPRFTPAAELDWRPVTSISVAPRPGPIGRPWRAYFDGFALDGVDFPARARAGAALPVRYSGYGDDLTFLLVPPHAVNSFVFPANGAPPMRVASGASTIRAADVEPMTEEGPYVLIAMPSGELRAVCHWMAWPTTGCVVADIEISGSPLPEGAANFNDEIALLDVEMEQAGLAPGGQLPVTITWQGLAEMSDDYTVFVQVLDAADRIVGQVDSWPVQGTRPTSQWRPGETVRDPYVVQLSPDMEPGDYRVIVGLYLLATGQRLPVVDAAGAPVDDKVEVGLTAGRP